MKDQTRREFLKTIGYSTLTAGSLSLLSAMGMTGCLSRKTKRPNVILVMTDDQGYGDIGAHGNPNVKTPALDELYWKSIRLTDFHVDPCCSPTRSALLTGLYSSRTGVWHTIGGRSLLKADKTTIADVFKADGYSTGIFGKWHLGDNYPFRPQDRGFDETVVHLSGVVGNRWDHWGNDYYDDTYYRNGVPEKFDGYCDTVWFSEALNFIKRNQSNPFFCFVSTNVPHAPLNINEKYAAPYKSQVSGRLANYYGMITKFDEDFAWFMQNLQSLGLMDNTILIFMTDNGPCPWYGGIKIDDDGFVTEGYSAGMRGGKIWGYENAHRAPCFIHWPDGGLTGGKDMPALSAHIDLLPTLIDLCGLSSSGNIELDGKSLAPLLRGESENHPERMLFVHNQRVDFPVKYKDYQVLTDKWRLVKTDKEELYDIKQDPGQKKDIAGEYPEVVKNLRRKYEEWWKDISQEFDVYPEIIIGSDHQNPAVMFGHDAHRGIKPSVWVINPAKDGRYRFRLSPWPKEAGKKIHESKFNAAQAHIRIGNAESECQITPDMQQAELVLDLKQGQTCLQAWFSSSNPDEVMGAEFVYAERTGPADADVLQTYSPSNPDNLLQPLKDNSA
jgi:arylsulfatase A-like enzyme